MKKLDDAKRRFGWHTGGYSKSAPLNPGEVAVVISPARDGFTLPTGVVLESDKPFINRGRLYVPSDEKLTIKRMQSVLETKNAQIEALNKLLDERDETIDRMVHNPQEIIGWLTCVALVVTVFLAHGLGYL